MTRDSIDLHYAGVWSAPVARIRWQHGPVYQLPDDFGVLVIPRDASTTAYATSGMSLPDDDEPLELHLLARTTPQPVDDLVELMTIVAHYHRTGRRVGLGHTVNFGRPWLPDSTCTSGLISLPYLDGPKLEWSESPPTRFLWLLPITVAEREFRHRHGLEALEDRFEASGFDYLDPARSSVV